jgi:hypothetical protein
VIRLAHPATAEAVAVAFGEARVGAVAEAADMTGAAAARLELNSNEPATIGATKMFNRMTRAPLFSGPIRINTPNDALLRTAAALFRPAVPAWRVNISPHIEPAAWDS